MASSLVCIVLTTNKLWYANKNHTARHRPPVKEFHIIASLSISEHFDIKLQYTLQLKFHNQAQLRIQSRLQ